MNAELYDMTVKLYVMAAVFMTIKHTAIKKR